MAPSFERVREQTGDVAAVSWSNMSSRHTELTRVNKSPILTKRLKGNGTASSCGKLGPGRRCAPGMQAPRRRDCGLAEGRPLSS